MKCGNRAGEGGRDPPLYHGERRADKGEDKGGVEVED